MSEKQIEKNKKKDTGSYMDQCAGDLSDDSGSTAGFPVLREPKVLPVQYGVDHPVYGAFFL